MFDIGFTEILIIATISLLVIGPERLPETVRAVSMWIGRLKRGLRDTRREIEQQIGADDIRRDLHNEEVMRSLEKVRHEVSDSLDEGLELENELYPRGHQQSQSPESSEDRVRDGSSNSSTGEPAALRGKLADETASEEAARKTVGPEQAKAGQSPTHDDSSSEPKNQ